MNKQPGSNGQAPKLDTPAAIWASAIWSVLILLFPVNIGLTPLDLPSIGSSLLMRMLVTGICIAAIGILICIAYFSLRHFLVSKGAAKSDLDAIARGIGRSFVFTLLIGGAVLLALLGAIVVSANLIGVWDTIAHGLHVTAEIAICMSIVAASSYIGWRLKGKSVYEKCIRQLSTASS